MTRIENLQFHCGIALCFVGLLAPYIVPACVKMFLIVCGIALTIPAIWYWANSKCPKEWWEPIPDMIIQMADIPPDRKDVYEMIENAFESYVFRDLHPQTGYLPRGRSAYSGSGI